MSAQPNAHRHLHTIALGLVALLFAQTILSYRPYVMAWDELYLIHRAVATHGVVWAGDAEGFARAFSILSKSPLLPLLSIAAGPTVQGDLLVGFCLLFHTLLLWGSILAGIALARRVGVSWLALGLAAAACALNPILLGYRGAFLADLPLAWAVALTGLWVHASLVAPETLPKKPLLAGAALGVIVCLGSLAKATYGLFAACWLPVVAYQVLRRHNRVADVVAWVAGLVITTLPAIVIWAGWGQQFLAHASSASWGGLGEYYRDGKNYLQLITQVSANLKWVWLPLGILLAVATLRLGTAPRAARWSAVLLAAPLFVYFALYLLSPNRDERFLFPLFVAVPLFATLAWTSGRRELAFGSFPVLLAGTVLLSLPTIGRPDLAEVRRASSILRAAAPQPDDRLLIATDSGHFNVETFILARELDHPGRGVTHTGTSAYDHMHNRPVEFSLDRIPQVHAVVFEWPLPQVPDFTNVRAAAMLEAAAKFGKERTDLQALGVRVFEIPPAKP